MSYGIVYCSVCKHELHQDGNPDVMNGWRHCDSGLPMCHGAVAAYPDSTNDIRGKWCGRDSGPSDSDDAGSGQQRVQRNQVYYSLNSEPIHDPVLWALLQEFWPDDHLESQQPGAGLASRVAGLIRAAA